MHEYNTQVGTLESLAAICGRMARVTHEDVDIIKATRKKLKINCVYENGEQMKNDNNQNSFNACAMATCGRRRQRSFTLSCNFQAKSFLIKIKLSTFC